jgi:hypothetical protein
VVNVGGSCARGEKREREKRGKANKKESEVLVNNARDTMAKLAREGRLVPLLCAKKRFVS